jgi:hypothetical protein
MELVSELLDSPAKTKFNPKFLHELVDYLYEDESQEVRNFALKQMLKDDQLKGRFWEQVLAKGMLHTVILERNAHYRDYADNSDAKFAMVCRYADGRMQATISGIEKKIGDLRICMGMPGANLHRIYFMRIPYSYYSKRSKHPLKITFQNFVPVGDIWDRFQCSFQEVIAP